MGDTWRAMLVLVSGVVLLLLNDSVARRFDDRSNSLSTNEDHGSDENGRVDAVEYPDEYYGLSPDGARRPSPSGGDILREMGSMPAGHVMETKRSDAWGLSICGKWDDWCTPGSNKPGLSCCDGYACKCKLLWNSNCRCRSRMFSGRR